MRRKAIVRIAASNSVLPKDFDVSQRNTKLGLPVINGLKLFSYFIHFQDSEPSLLGMAECICHLATHIHILTHYFGVWGLVGFHVAEPCL